MRNNVFVVFTAKSRPDQIFFEQDSLRLNPREIVVCSVKNKNKIKLNVHNPSYFWHTEYILK